MKLVIVFSSLLMLSCVAGQAALQKCYNIALYLSGVNPPSTCAYIEDAVRCGIKDLGLTKSSATKTEIDDAKSTSNSYFTDNSCTQTFDSVFNAVKARTVLLDLQQCIDTALTKGQADAAKSCTYVKEAVVCGIKVLSLDKDSASDSDLQFGRALATRYLTPYGGCGATFDSILEGVKNSGQDALQKCYNIAQSLSGVNPTSTCAYIEDAVRCGIKDLGLTKSSATKTEIDNARSASDGYFTKNSCSQRFDSVLNAVKARTDLLDLQQCIDTALTKGQADPSKSCTYVKEAVVCGIGALSLDKDSASDSDLQFGRALATRYLTPYGGCGTTFDSILEGVKNSGPTVSPIGWLTAVMVAFILMFTAV